MASIILSLCVGCAGPSNPFGSSVGWSLKDTSKDPYFHPVSFSQHNDEKDDGVRIEFSPQRIDFTEGKTFKIKIFDKRGISPSSSLKISFNHKDVTETFLSRAVQNISRDGKTMTYTVSGVRFTSGKNSDLWIYYRASEFDPYVAKYYEEPYCPVEKRDWRVGELSNFTVSKNLISFINGLGKKEKINPSFLAGLIAQESGFNPFAVSSAKALGLTQVTSSAGHHVLESRPKWPVFDSISSMSYSNIKFYIRAGFINAENDWRLDERKSIEGGLLYLEYLIGYWSMKEQQFVLDTLPDYEMTDILLASYNSGAYRVKKAIKEMGSNWQKSHDLLEARKYLRKVKSYCYNFKEENAGEYL